MSTRSAAVAPKKLGVILIVDDEIDIRESMRARLEIEGFEVITAANGLDGLRRYKQFKDQVEIVVTDLDMPRMNGSDMLRQIFQITPAAKVIVASGRSLLYSQHNLGAQGGCCLQKPYTGRELTDAVRLLL